MLYLTTTWECTIIHIDPKTKEIKSLKLSSSVIFDSQEVISAGRLILAQRSHTSYIYIIQPDMTFQKIDVKSPVGHAIEGNGHSVIALNKQPLEENGELAFEIFSVDVLTGEFTKEMLRLPGFRRIGAQTTRQANEKYFIDIVSVSTDLKMFCYLYVLGGNNKVRYLGVYNREKSEEMKAISDPMLVNTTLGYAQYHNFLFVSNSGGQYDNVPAALINMLTLEPVIDLNNHTVIPDRGRRDIRPYGDSFLIGTFDVVHVVSTEGKIVATYPLPPKWINQQYNLMYYRK